MNMKKALPFVFNVLVILTLVIFVQPSSSTRLNGASMLESKAMATTTEVEGFGSEGGGSSVGTLEDSARKVPTGPDPLHHNNNPILRP